ncbi:MAG: Ig-like domain-containing protein, partial [Candidatus Krumholzibacteriota bacterium]
MSYVAGANLVDAYINWDYCVHTYFAFAGSVARGGLPHLPGFDMNRIFINIREPWLEWPDVSAMKIRLSTTNYTFDASVIDAEGDALPLADCTSTWSVVSGPVTTGIIEDPSVLAATMTFPLEGTYQVRLDVSHGGLSTYEVIDMEVTAPVAPVPLAILTQPVDQNVALGGTASFTILATGPDPKFYQWRLNGQPLGVASTSPDLTLDNVGGGNAGLYDCAITAGDAALVSQTAELTISDAGYGSTFSGGLWQELYTGIPGSQVSDLTASPDYPYFADSSAVITNAETGDLGNQYGQRWTGWLVPTNSADYRFFVTAGDAYELRVSQTASPLDAQLVSASSTASWVRQWSMVTPSDWLSFTNGGRYYIELLHKRNLSGGHAEITWQRSGEANPTDGSPGISGTHLEYRMGGIYPDPSDPPVVNDDYLISTRGAPATADVADNDVHGDPLGLRVRSITQPAFGVAVFNGRDVTYTPNPGYSGDDSFTYVVGSSDGPGATGTVHASAFVRENVTVTNFQAEISDSYHKIFETGADNGLLYLTATHDLLAASTP